MKPTKKKHLRPVSLNILQTNLPGLLKTFIKL